MSNEIKPSFSFKYVFLVLLTALITSGVTIIIQKYQGDEKHQKIGLTQRGGLNELNFNSSDESTISVKYSLKNDTSRVEGYYRKTVIITNIGEIGLENLKFKLTCKDTNVTLISNPKFESYPKGVDQIEIKIDKISSNQNNLFIPLLNIDEGVSISYEAYSKKPIPLLDLDISIRQKDLAVERIDSLVVKEEESITSVIFLVLKYASIIISIFALVLTFMFYRTWINNNELKNKYRGNFWAYWWKGY